MDNRLRPAEAIFFLVSEDDTPNSSWYGPAVRWTDGDFDDDNLVGPADASILAANWGYGTEEGNSAVPEPGIFVPLLGLGLAIALRRTRRYYGM